MFTVFGVLAVIVAAVGLYGIIGYQVDQHMHELGVRVALGAQRNRMVRLVVGRSLRLAITGTAIGGLAAAFAGRWIQPLLFQQSAMDGRVYALAGGVMLLIAIAAAAVPAGQASRADPVVVLRGD
jgi:ABC-type antimicrobial peptide transport system permease subunit